MENVGRNLLIFGVLLAVMSAGCTEGSSSDDGFKESSDKSGGSDTVGIETAEQKCIETVEKELAEFWTHRQEPENYYEERRTFEVISSTSFTNSLRAGDFTYKETGHRIYPGYSDHSRKVLPYNSSNGDFINGAHPIVIVKTEYEGELLGEHFEGEGYDAALCNVEGTEVLIWAGEQ